MNHYPAIDVSHSISRVMIDIVSARQTECANRFRSIMATYEEARDLIDIGAYKKGSNPRIDESIALIDKCNSFLKQSINDESIFAGTLKSLEDSIHN